ncbi:MAG: o-succinylbenzoate synthase [Gemmatimonadales bacterium]|nr:MAG: o-succinylbenzoate synthase [Gemmatimonadales bacterium]
MKIDSVELREIRLPLREPFVTSSGRWHIRSILLVRVRGEGLEGWGECVAAEDPGYSYETSETAWHVLTEHLLPGLVGREVMGPGEVLDHAPHVRGHRMAKAAMEMAVWDLHARAVGVPLWEMLGGSGAPVPVGVSIGLQAGNDALLRKVEGYLEEGYRRIKVKVKPGRDVAMLRAVRDRFGDVPLMADANSAYTLGDLPMLKEMDDLELLMIEQPLGHEDLLDHAALQAELRTPVCLDESIRSVGDVRLALHLDAGRIINIKPGRVGGLAESRAIHDVCREAGVPVWCGGMLESGIGRAFNVALAGLPGFTLPGDLSGSRRYWEEDIVSPEWEPVDGYMGPVDGPGIGVELRMDRIEALTRRRVEFPGGTLIRP